MNDVSFLSPDDMSKAVKQFCIDTEQTVPHTTGELAAVIYNSLAACYGRTVQEIENNINQKCDCIHIIGGGSKAAYLNQLTANATGKTVYAGPGEATAICNIMVQLIADKQLKDLEEARKCVYHSFEIETYKPEV